MSVLNHRETFKQEKTRETAEKRVAAAMKTTLGPSKVPRSQVRQARVDTYQLEGETVDGKRIRTRGKKKRPMSENPASLAPKSRNDQRSTIKKKRKPTRENMEEISFLECEPTSTANNKKTNTTSKKWSTVPMISPSRKSRQLS